MSALAPSKNNYCLANYNGRATTFRTKHIYLTQSMPSLQQAMISCIEIDVLHIPTVNTPCHLPRTCLIQWVVEQNTIKFNFTGH